MLLGLIKLLDFFASGGAQSVLLALQDREELQTPAGAQPQALSAPGRGCRQLPPQTITHVAEKVLLFREEGVTLRQHLPTQKRSREK